MKTKYEYSKDKLQKLEQQVEDLQRELCRPNAPKRELVSTIQQILVEIEEIKIKSPNQVEVSLQPLSNPKVFGDEITQGLSEYELIAGKDTLMRVFVGAKEQVMAPVLLAKNLSCLEPALLKGLQYDQPVFGASRLDFATLQISGPLGSSFEVPAKMSGLFTNFSKSLSEDDNINFYIPGNLLDRVGSYDFVARFYRDGALVGTNDLGTHQFKDTKDLRLLIVVDTWPMPADAWTTLLRALEFLQRNMPIRSGIAPLDSDLMAGLRFYIDPVPFDPDWPAWGPVAQYLTEFNQRQASNGKPDRADKIMTVRTQQAGESLLAGTGQQPGNISGVVLNVDPSGSSYFATVISQEIGHNFNLGHSPSPVISSTTVFDILNKKSLPTAFNIMNNPVGNSKSRLFSAEDWSTIRNGLLQLDSTGPI